MTFIGIAAAAVVLYGAWLISTGLYWWSLPEQCRKTWFSMDDEDWSRVIDVLVGLVLVLVGSFTVGVIVRLG